MKIRFSIDGSGITSRIAIFLAALALPISLLYAQGNYTSVDISSTVTAGPVVNAKTITSSPSSPAGNLSGEVHPNRFPRLLPPMQNTGDLLEQAPISPLAPTPDAAHSFFRGFTGLTHLDQRFANGGNQFSHEPPDQGWVGDGELLGNRTVEFGLPEEFNRTTGVINTSVGDPSCLFDPETQRWFVVSWAQLNTTSGAPLRQSRLYLAVSQTSDPRGAYATYTFNTTGANDVDQAGPRIPDFPHFAVDHYGLFINWQEFKIDKYSFTLLLTASI